MPENLADASYAQTASMTCPACGHGFEFDVWLIVDTARRPDLVERIRNRTLHFATPTSPARGACGSRPRASRSWCD